MTKRLQPHCFCLFVLGTLGRWSTTRATQDNWQKFRYRRASGPADEASDWEDCAILAELFNRSMSAGHFPAACKDAFITPALKKPGLDPTNVQSYPPISNLSVVSKLLQRIVTRPLNNHLMSANLLPSLQPGFRPGHSAELAFFGYCQTYWRLSTTGILLLWLY